MHIPSGMGRPGHLGIKDPKTLYSVGALPEEFEFECNVSRATRGVIIRSDHVTLAHRYELREPKMSTGVRRGAEKSTCLHYV